MKTPGELKAAALRYRELARTITDQRAIEALRELADEYEKQAEQQSGRVKGAGDIRTDDGG